MDDEEKTSDTVAESVKALMIGMLNPICYLDSSSKFP